MRNLFVRSKVIVAALCLAGVGLVPGSASGAEPDAKPGAEPDAKPGAEPSEGAASESFNPACRRFQERYVRSAARKLYRALRGEHDLKPLLLQPWVDAALDGRPVRFALHTEHDGLVGGLVPEGTHADKTYIVAQTADGPVVAELNWKPTGGSCRVVESRLAYPRVAGDSVRPEPFRLWGQRVVWHVPREREGKGERDLYAALVDVFRGKPSANVKAKAKEGPPAPKPGREDASAQK